MLLRVCEASFKLVLLNVGRTTRPMLAKIFKLFYANIYGNYNGELNGRSHGVYMKHKRGSTNYLSRRQISRLRRSYVVTSN